MDTESLFTEQEKKLPNNNKEIILLKNGLSELLESSQNETQFNKEVIDVKDFQYWIELISKHYYAYENHKGIFENLKFSVKTENDRALLYLINKQLKKLTLYYENLIEDLFERGNNLISGICKPSAPELTLEEEIDITFYGAKKMAIILNHFQDFLKEVQSVYNKPQ